MADETTGRRPLSFLGSCTCVHSTQWATLLISGRVDTRKLSAIHHAASCSHLLYVAYFSSHWKNLDLISSLRLPLFICFHHAKRFNSKNKLYMFFILHGNLEEVNKKKQYRTFHGNTCFSIQTNSKLT